MLVDDVLAIISNFVTGITFADGNGIESTTDNGNGTFTFLFTDGTTFTTSDLTGADGTLTGYTSNWKYSTSTSTPPPNTFLRFNNSNLSLATKLYISETDLNSVSKASFLENFTSNYPTLAGDIPRYGIVKIFNLLNLNTFASFEITGVSYLAGYQAFDVTYLQGNGTLTNNTNIGVTFTPSETITKEDTILLAGWNMDTTNVFSYAHGFTDYTKIISVSVMIKDDVGSANLPLNSFDGTNLQGGVYDITSTHIRLFRLTGGIFDSTVFDGVGDRGYITIKYLK